MLSRLKTFTFLKLTPLAVILAGCERADVKSAAPTVDVTRFGAKADDDTRNPLTFQLHSLENKPESIKTHHEHP